MNKVVEKWDEILQIVKTEHDLSDVSFNTWLKSLTVYEVVDNVVTIIVPSEQVGLNYISKKYKLPLQVTISEVTGMENCDINFILPEDVPKKEEVDNIYLTPEQIQVVVHPQSVIHSMVQFEDGAVIAQLGIPDMKLPISYAFSYPKRLHSKAPRLDFTQYATLTFEEPDMERFRNLAFAFDAVRKGGNMPCILNAANEVVVAAFLRDEIGFLDIGRLVEGIVDSDSFGGDYTLADVHECDRMARAYVEAHI